MLPAVAGAERTVLAEGGAPRAALQTWADLGILRVIFVASDGTFMQVLKGASCMLARYFFKGSLACSVLGRAPLLLPGS